MESRNYPSVTAHSRLFEVDITLRTRSGERRLDAQGVSQFVPTITDTPLRVVQVPIMQDRGDTEAAIRLEDRRRFWVKGSVSALHPGDQNPPVILHDGAEYEVTDVRQWGSFTQIDAVRRDTA